MTIDILGCAMYHDIRAQRKRLLDVRGCKGVVHNDLNGWIIRVGNLADSLNVCDFQIGICGGFQIDRHGIFFEVCLDFLQIRGIDHGDFHAIPCHAMAQQCKGTAVKGFISNDMLAGAGDAP